MRQPNCPSLIAALLLACVAGSAAAQDGSLPRSGRQVDSSLPNLYSWLSSITASSRQPILLRLLRQSVQVTRKEKTDDLKVNAF